MSARLIAYKGLIAATDATFNFTESRRGLELIGKCIMCRRKQVALSEGHWSPTLTIEHINARSHGGLDTVANLALACATCNHRKGRKVDVLGASNPSRLALVEQLRAERSSRLRPPVSDTRFGPLAASMEATARKDPEWMHFKIEWRG